jgi:putative oxidoreductase
MQINETLATFIGRILMSLLFILGGWGKLMAPAATQAMLASHNLPMPEAGWVLAVVVELGGGLAILFGLLTRPVAFICAIWCVATALIGHSNFADRNMEIHFFKNMGLTGGFLYIAVFGAGAWSLDGLLTRRRTVPAE